MPREKVAEAYFVFPPILDDIKIIRPTTVEINYTTGRVRGRGLSKSLPQLQGSLNDVGRTFVRSLFLETDKMVRIFTDTMGNKNLIRVRGGDTFQAAMLPFKILYIKTLQSNTTLNCVGGTSLMGFQPHLTKTPTAINSGQVTIATGGTAQPLTATSTEIKSVIITALKTNTGDIYYGTSTVSSTTGDIITPGSNRSIKIDDLSKVYINGTTGDKVSYAYVA